jgi:hypothetical protein
LIEHKVVVVHCELPIPVREWDWCAYYEDEEGQLHKYGWGKSRGEAMLALARLKWAKNVKPSEATELEWMGAHNDVRTGNLRRHSVRNRNRISRRRAATDRPREIE